jgi:integrase
LGLLRAILCNSLKNAVEDNILIKNPASGLKLPKKTAAQQEKIKPFTKAELQTILKGFEGTKHHYIVYLAALTGMRRGELLGLRWQDIDLTKKVIHVRQQAKMVNTDRRMTTGILKTENAYRDIPVDDLVVVALKKQSAWQAANKLKLGDAYLTDGNLVFTDEAGKILVPGVVSESFRRVVKRVKVDYRSFHHLRHTFASIAISSGVGIKAISVTMGHATVVETLDTYGHLMPGDNQAVTAAVAKFLAGL